MTMQAMLAQKKAMTPKKGFNLVGLDDFEEPGEQLFLIGHYESKAEAEKADKEHNSRNKDVRTFIYGPDEENESLASAMKRLVDEPAADNWD
jgi:hypothetical protein